MGDAVKARVCVSVQYEIEYGRGVSMGIVAYARQKTNWRLWRQREVNVKEVISTKTDGLVCQNLTPQQTATLQAAGVAIVRVAQTDLLPNLAIVAVDEESVASLAADHLLELGLRQFAFVGSGHWPFVHRRLAGFNAALALKAMGPAQVFIESLYEEENRQRFESSLERWLAKLPLPCGVLAANDAVGVEVIASARRAGLRVPDQLAVVGVDDDHLLCELSEVPLSSVAQPTYAIVYEASRMLHEKMANPSQPSTSLWLPAPHVARRASSDLVAIDDEAVAMALRLIRDHVTEQIGVDWILKQMPVARRSLERQFRAVVGRSILEHIQHLRVQKARQLLAETDLGLKTIATMSGFQSTRWLSQNFTRHTGASPGEFRRQVRGRV